MALEVAAIAVGIRDMEAAIQIMVLDLVRDLAIGPVVRTPVQGLAAALGPVVRDLAVVLDPVVVLTLVAVGLVVVAAGPAVATSPASR